MADEDEFTGRETERQDCVDNLVYNLMLELGLTDEDTLEWDIEEIGEVRDLIQEILVDKHKLMTKQEFYPYRELDNDGNIILEPSKPAFILDEDQIISKMGDFLNEIDTDELARLAGEFFGGECYFGGGDYNFYPNENYNDAFGSRELLG
jgi:hypothetical protein